MKVNDFYAYREEVSRNGVFLTFNGAMVHGFMVKMGETLKTKLSMSNVDNNLGNKIFSILIELAQNVVFYSSERVSDEFMENDLVGVGMLTVGQEGGHYFVMSGNRMPSASVEKLRGKLERLQSMNQDELKQYYKEQRRMDPDSDSKGAGLGFIEMARKVNKNIEFDFHKIDDENSFFTFKATV
jgi:Family of unknown function (DUF6272)